MAENKQLERDYTLFSLPVNLYHLVELASAHEETITKTAAQRKVIKREKELQLERKQMEHLRSSKRSSLLKVWPKPKPKKLGSTRLCIIVDIVL